MELSRLRKYKDRIAHALERRRRAFVEKQKIKQNQWKRKDANQLDNMNFPYLPISAHQLSRVDVIYKTPKYNGKEGGGNGVEHQAVLPPYFKIRPEMTAFVKGQSDDKTYITKLPKVVEVDSTMLKRYTKFCGVNKHSKPLLDQRFCNLATSLVRFGTAPGARSSDRRKRQGTGSDDSCSSMSAITPGTNTSEFGSKEGLSLPPSRSATFSTNTSSSRRQASGEGAGQRWSKESADSLLAEFCLNPKRSFVF